MKKILENIIKLFPLQIRKKLFYALQRSIRGDIAYQYLNHNQTVLDGEFKGMKLTTDVSVQNYTLAHMLGIYEPNIQKTIIDRMDDYNRFVDIGCASGVFTVGVPFVTGKESLGFDVDSKQIKYADKLSTLNNVSKLTKHQVVIFEEDYNKYLKEGDFCLVDIEGGELELLNSISLEIRKNVAFFIEVHEIGTKKVSDVVKELIEIMKATHNHIILDEECSMDFNAIESTQSISRNDFVYFSNGQRDYFQKWIVFEPK